MGRTLIIRLSALGDVAMSIPVIYSIAQNNPEEEFIMVTKKFNSFIFINKPENLQVIPVDTYLERNEIKGLWHLVRDIGDIDKVADLHDVIRSKFIRSYYWIQGKKVSVMDKGKKEKRTLTRRKNKILKPLMPTYERYRKVFSRLGLEYSTEFISLFEKKEKTLGTTFIGIAPLARHSGKIYPLDQMEKVVESLSKRENVKLFLFGSKSESSVLKIWEEKYTNVESIAGKLKFEEELSLINRLDVMISMDSANMHLASLVNTPVISIWGPTHPYSGFYGYNQNLENAIQLDLPCRPCSIFGKKPCWRKDYTCLVNINPQIIIDKINQVLSNNLSK